MELVLEGMGCVDGDGFRWGGDFVGMSMFSEVVLANKGTPS